MKTFSTSLYELIKSMTASEKRLFLQKLKKLSLQEHLFQLINQQIMQKKEYDECFIREKLEQEHSITLTTPKFSKLKHKLFERIIQYLQEISEEDSLIYWKELLKIHTLMSRKLYDEALKRLKKLYKKSKERGYLFHQLQVLQNLFIIELRKENIFDVDFQKIEKIMQEKRHCTNYILQLNKSYKEYARLFVFYAQNEKPFTPLQLQELRQIYNNIQTIEITPSAPLVLKMQKNSFLALYHDLHSEADKSFLYYKKIFEIEKKHPWIFRKNLYHHLGTIHNLIYSAAEVKKFSFAHSVLNYLKELKQKHKKALAQEIITERILLLETYIYYTSVEVSKGMQKIPQWIETYQKHEKKFTPRFLPHTQFYIGMIYFLNEHYAKALQWIQKAISQTHPLLISKTDYSIFLFIHLIIHYELKNYDIIDYLIRRLHKTLRKFNQKMLILLLLQLLKASRKTTYSKIIIDYNYLYNYITCNPEITNSWQIFDIKTWIKSKIGKKKFALLLKEKLYSQEKSVLFSLQSAGRE